MLAKMYQFLVVEMVSRSIVVDMDVKNDVEKKTLYVGYDIIGKLMPSLLSLIYC